MWSIYQIKYSPSSIWPVDSFMSPTNRMELFYVFSYVAVGHLEYTFFFIKLLQWTTDDALVVFLLLYGPALQVILSS